MVGWTFTQISLRSLIGVVTLLYAKVHSWGWHITHQWGFWCSSMPFDADPVRAHGRPAKASGECLSQGSVIFARIPCLRQGAWCSKWNFPSYSFKSKAWCRHLSLHWQWHCEFSCCGDYSKSYWIGVRFISQTVYLLVLLNSNVLRWMVWSGEVLVCLWPQGFKMPVCWINCIEFCSCLCLSSIVVSCSPSFCCSD